MGILESSVFKLISAGFFLGIGFWSCKKLTGCIDQRLIQNNREMMDQYVKELKHGC